MKVTVIGIIVIILSIIAFFKKDEDWLLGLVMFFSVFTATTAFDSNFKVVIPFKIPMYLWCIRQVIDFIKIRPKINLTVIKNILKNNKIFTALLVLALIILLSNVWLFVSNLNINYQDGLYKDERVITFDKNNIKQTLGILTYIGFAMLVSLRINEKERIEKLLKIFAISSCFAVIWGLIQFIIYYLQIDYPVFLFNNNEQYYQGFDQIMHGIKRISSIGTEPSVFSLNLLGFIPILLIPVVTKNESENKKQRIIVRIFLILSIVCAILTTSSTALIGITVIMLALLIYYIKKLIKKDNTQSAKGGICRVIIYSTISILLALVICLIAHEIYVVNEMYENTVFEAEFQKDERTGKVNSNVWTPFLQMTVAKLSSGSGLERLAREAQGLELYKNSIVFGLGFGSFRTFSIITNMLVNTGIIGVLSIIYIWIISFGTLLKNRKNNEKIALTFLLSLLGMTVALITSVPDLIYIYYWLIIVFGYKYFNSEQKQIEENNIAKKEEKKQLNIGIDARGLDVNKTGITTYIEETVKRIVEQDKNNKYILYSSREIKIDIKENDNIILKNCNKKKGTLWLYFDLPKMLKEDNIDVFWGTQHLLPRRNKYTKGIKYILTVHDLAIHKLKTVGEWKNTIIQKLFLERSCKSADLIMADSKSTKDDITEIFKIKPEKIEVVYLGTNFSNGYNVQEKKEKEILKKFNVEDKNYLMFVSTIEPRKNIVTLVKSFNELKEHSVSRRIGMEISSYS